MKKMTPAADEKFARESIDLLRQKQFEQLKRELDATISDPDADDTLTTMVVMFPHEEPKSAKVVGLNFLLNSGSSIHNLTLEYEFTETWLLVNISINRTNEVPTIAALNVTPIAESLESINRFGLIGKSPLHYLMLSLALAGPIFSLYVLVACLRTKNLHMKWLWALFVSFGLGRLAINWTTGELAFTPLAVHIPCASVTAVPAYGPWVLAVSFPLGAFLFLIKRRGEPTLREAGSAPEEQLPATPVD